jgi:hypothetical protein
LGSYRADALLGCAGRLSAHAAEMMTLAGVAQSFHHGSLLLQRRAGWTACHEMVRQACYRQADAASAQRAAAAPEAEPFRQAQGQAEFQADATTVNTLDGWRDMKIGVFA